MPRERASPRDMEARIVRRQPRGEMVIAFVIGEAEDAVADNKMLQPAAAAAPAREAFPIGVSAVLTHQHDA